MKNRMIAIFLLSLSLLLSLTSCGKKDRYELKDKYTDKPAYGDTMVDSSIGEPATLNPVLASDSASFNVIGMIFNGLVKYDKDLKLTGDLAERWTVSADSKLITFYLKKGVKWQDGEEFTSADVKFTYDSFMDPKVKTSYRSSFELVAGVDTPDKYTVKVRYKKPYAPALESWGMSIIPSHLLKDKDLNTAEFNRKPVGTGPYRFKSWTTAQSVELTANKDYFEGEPYITNYIYRIIPDQSVQFMEMMAGSLDTMLLNSDLYFTRAATDRFNKNFNKYQIKAFQYVYLGFNFRNPLFGDKRVRQALSFAINKKDLIDGVKRGLAEKITGPYIPGTWAYNENAVSYDYNMEKARDLLAAAGWIKGKDGMLEKDGKKFEFTLMTNQGNKEREQIATIIQQQLLQLGIKAEVRILAWNIFITEFIDRKKFDAIVMGWTTGRDPDNYDIWHSSKTKDGEFNFISYANPEVDKLLEQGRTTFDIKAREKTYKRIHEIIADDAPYVFLYTPYELPAFHKRFHGIKPEASGIGYNFIRWYVPEELIKYRTSN